MHPHDPCCIGCRTLRQCNGCGKALHFGDRCTNGRCNECHGRLCGPGGGTAPGHAGWVGTREAFNAAWRNATEDHR